MEVAAAQRQLQRQASAPHGLRARGAAPPRLPHRRRCRCAAAGAAAEGAPQAAPAAAAVVALKEWAPTCAALGAGEQTILIRKGGIKEPKFVPEAAAFLLFPTSFHTDQQLLKPGAASKYREALDLDPKQLPAVPLAQYAEVTGAWTTRDERVLQVLSPLHVWADAFRDTRLKWRRAQPLTLLELRAYRLEPPLQLPRCEELFGCFSWVGTPGLAPEAVAAAVARRVPALGDAAFAERQALLRERLASLEAEPLAL
ncbi:hypothetical protein Rsub_07893 [Raphidocelis subcapitata]|uniref:Uncharacterized protein n=1 Tax=Raphidocelis subcapitata TaxID=307507 RepID=A0A2V0PBC0_9CHLO|nr:hypothetical protein Rsub_07893 [Raphidocelis subcapitata]|eukprot:GBF95180.1 hypothetical protein Rsub_07893 [Raphidocelis subcapitata]